MLDRCCCCTAESTREMRGSLPSCGHTREAAQTREARTCTLYKSKEMVRRLGALPPLRRPAPPSGPALRPTCAGSALLLWAGTSRRRRTRVRARVHQRRRCLLGMQACQRAAGKPHPPRAASRALGSSAPPSPGSAAALCEAGGRCARPCDASSSPWRARAGRSRPAQAAPTWRRATSGEAAGARWRSAPPAAWSVRRRPPRPGAWRC
mmetsp:Transcript_23544/g.65896  ORF Transcript_23544/g.65896 Transcript_23544/m.65896 type:complete len:208 (-) Transcript_23544:2697-3320(-)